MSFKIDNINKKKVHDETRNITVELDYADSDNKKVIYHSDECSDSLIFVDNRNFSCDIYLQQGTTDEIISELPNALSLLGFLSDHISFQQMDSQEEN
jgi:hypothetical protein